MRALFPFSAVIGQEDLKLALVLNTVNPAIGGVLVRGEKGTAKSTIVRSMAELLPRSGSRSGTGSGKVVTLPLNATEDRVAGGMDFEAAMRRGQRVLQPGLLAEAHHGILYVDEINLLDDHIVDIILDAAASGENRVEREGISLSHPSQFLLVGTMNPEEGDLRPQLLDRFGFCVEVAGEADPERRVELMLIREQYDMDPQGFNAAHALQTRALAGRIAGAAERLPAVRMPGQMRTFIAELCTASHVAGHRADLVMARGALAHAAWEGRTEVIAEDIRVVARFALLHRKQEAGDPPPPPPPPPPPEEQTDESPVEKGEPDKPENNSESPGPPAPPDDAGPEPKPDKGDDTPEPPKGSENGTEIRFEIGEPFGVKKIETPKDRELRRGSGRRSRTRVSQKQGRYVKSTMNRGNNDIAFDATLRAAAPFQKVRGIPDGMCVALRSSDIREKIREKKMGNFLLFLVDASGSMGAKGRMTASKGAILSLLLDAYRKRDKVAMISFRKTEAVVNLPVTASIELAAQYLARMAVGGRTPLSAGLEKASEMIRNLRFRDPASRPIVIIITDGKSNVAMGSMKPVDEALVLAGRMGADDRTTSIVVDTEARGPVMFGLARQLAEAANAQYYKIEDLRSDTLVDLVRENR